VFYLSHRARRHSMNKIVHMFDNNTLSNDYQAFTIANTHFNILSKVLGKMYNHAVK
jgi:hypothetical protein